MFGSFLRRGKPAPETSKTPQSIKLTERQLILLSKAAARDDGLVLPPDGMAREEFECAFGPLVRSGLISRDDDSGEAAFRISVAGLAAIGIGEENHNSLAEKANAPAAPVPTRQRKVRVSKKAVARDVTCTSGTAWLEPETGLSMGRTPALIALLQRSEGARLDEIQQAFGWKPHTARAALSRLRASGHVPIREKSGDDGQHIYRLQAANGGS